MAKAKKSKDPRGRKSIPEEEKKVAIPIYPKKFIVDKLGKEAIQEIGLHAVEEEYNKQSKNN